MSTIVPFNSMMKALFPLPGQPVEQWVLDARAKRRELERTGKRVRVEPHLDNTGAPCRDVGPASLVDDLCMHDCCGVCNEHGARLERIDHGDLPRVLQASNWRHYAVGPYAPNWYAWCAMWFEITSLRARGFEADKVMFG